MLSRRWHTFHFLASLWVFGGATLPVHERLFRGGHSKLWLLNMSVLSRAKTSVCFMCVWVVYYVRVYDCSMEGELAHLACWHVCVSPLGLILGRKAQEQEISLLCMQNGETLAWRAFQDTRLEFLEVFGNTTEKVSVCLLHLSLAGSNNAGAAYQFTKESIMLQSIMFLFAYYGSCGRSSCGGNSPATRTATCAKVFFLATRGQRLLWEMKATKIVMMKMRKEEQRQTLAEKKKRIADAAILFKKASGSSSISSSFLC